MRVRQARERGRKEQSIAEHPLWTQCLKLHILSQEPEKERNQQNRFPAVCNKGPALVPDYLHTPRELYSSKGEKLCALVHTALTQIAGPSEQHQRNFSLT